MKFQQIVDSRFNEDLPILEARIKQILDKLSAMPGVTVIVSEPYRIDWIGTPDPPHVQYRATFQVLKIGRKSTWDDVMSAVNSVKAVYYNFRSDDYRRPQS